MVTSRKGGPSTDVHEGCSGLLAPAPVSGADPFGLSDVTNLGGDGRRLFAFNVYYSDLAYDLANSATIQIRRHAAFQIQDVAFGATRLPSWGGPCCKRTSSSDPCGSASSTPAGTTSAASTRCTAKQRRSFGEPFHPTAEAWSFRRTARSPSSRRPRQGSCGFQRQPTIDDLLDTADGLAIVVRCVEGELTWWELWFPDERATRRMIRLGLSESHRFGDHLHCDTRESRIACVFGKSTALDQPATPVLALFDLRQTQRR
jgi:hypothetical protein